MNYKQFESIITEIQKLHTKQRNIQKVMSEDMCDGHFVVELGSDLACTIIDYMSEHFACGDLIYWWLYEEPDYIIEENNKKYVVKSIKQLYKFLEGNRK